MILGRDADTIWGEHGLSQSCPSLPAWLARRAAATPDRPAVTFVDYAADPDGVPATVTFAELDRRVNAVAAHLAGLVTRDERVAILAPQGIDYVAGFLGVLRAGAIAVPLFSPDLPGHAQRLSAVLADCEPACVLAVRANAKLVRGFTGAQPGRRRQVIVTVDEISGGPPPSFTPPRIGSADPAYLQYTSGSTRAPAGVIISHGNIVANTRQAIAALLCGDDRGLGGTVVSWLPLFHDMGLVLAAGGCLVGGLHAVLMDPVAFLLQPVRWLRLLSAYPLTISMAPNFAFDYCAKRVSEADKAALRLDNVLLILNGAEPVNPATLRRFNDAFGACGFPARAISPGYGLAEATVFVTADYLLRGPEPVLFDAAELSLGIAAARGPGHPGAQPLMGCGAPIGQWVAITDPANGRNLPDGTVGEIWVNGPNVARGYWRNEDLTRQMFGQVLGGDLPEGAPRAGWLRTGDLGVIHDGALYITGRIKDLIVVGGRNHYPQDIEATVEEAHHVIARHRVAAFAGPAGLAESVIVVAEVSRHAPGGSWEPRTVTRDVRVAISNQHGLPVHDVVLVAPNEIPRTSSGKIARTAARERYLSGELALADTAPAPAAR